ncbi:uncharacterized protein BDW70DRAFT_141883 [Aspergillus foveolatus]|uniref:uncharacterized protein n=1 Tax=Aspergillus foveolatus TaxID=210207 RepID=UPI003CCD10C6
MLRTRFDPNMDYLARELSSSSTTPKRTYSGILFWNSMDKPRSSQESLDVKICLFCYCRNPLSCVDSEPDTDIGAFTPAQFDPAQCVASVMSIITSDWPILHRSEFTDIAQRLIATIAFKKNYPHSRCRRLSFLADR